VKLNIGAGTSVLPGYEPWDIAKHRDAYPLRVEDGSIEAIYASHILEHFPHAQTLAVLADWVRALQPGGTLQVAVPDFQKIAAQFLAGNDGNWESYVCGGQTDANDTHRAIFNRAKLTELLTLAGLEDIKPWSPVIEDCAALPISLNLQGTKPAAKAATPTSTEVLASEYPPPATHAPTIAPSCSGMPKAQPIAPAPAKVVAVWSVPRLGFMDTFKSIYTTLPAYGIPLSTGQGVFWGQALEKAMEQAIEVHAAQWFLALDYDSVFTPADLSEMFRILNAHPQEIDCLSPFQWCRTRSQPLFSPVPDAQGNLPPVSNVQLLANDIFPVSTAHFGFTLIRAAAVARMPHPWFMPLTALDGTWGEGRVDDDIYFWRKFRLCGGRMYMAPKVTIGHAELDLRWPGADFKLLHQHMYEYNAKGKPAGVFGSTPTPTTEGKQP